MADTSNFGIWGLIGFKDLNSVPILGGIKSRLEGLKENAKGLAKGAKLVGKGLGDIAVPLTAMGAAAVAGFGTAVKEASDFAGTIQFAGSLAGFKTADEFKLLAEEAKKLGRTTSFSAQQAAEGMVVLGKAGLKTADEIKATLSPALGLAASDNVEMAQATEILVNAVSQMGMKFEDSAKVANALAAASAASTTGVVDLGYSFNYAAGTARLLKIPLVDFTTALAAMAEQGLKGSMAGTSLNMALLRTANVTPRAQKALASMGMSVKDIQQPLPQMIENLKTGMARLRTDPEKTAAVMKIFGTDSAKAIMALAQTSKEKMAQISSTIRTAVETGVGGAADIAAKKLDNIQGDFIMLNSAVKGATLAIGLSITDNLRGPIQDVTAAANQFALGIDIATGKVSATTDEAKKVSPVMLGIAQGFVDFRDSLFSAWNWAKQFFAQFSGNASPLARDITSIVLKVAGIGAVLGPVLLLVKLFAPAFLGLFSVIKGGLIMAFNPITLAVLGVVGAMKLMGVTTEDVGKACIAVWEWVASSEVWNYMLGIWDGLRQSFGKIKEALVNDFQPAIRDIFNDIKATFDLMSDPKPPQAMADNARAAGTEVGSAMGSVVEWLMAIPRKFREFGGWIAAELVILGKEYQIFGNKVGLVWDKLSLAIQGFMLQHQGILQLMYGKEAGLAMTRGLEEKYAATKESIGKREGAIHYLGQEIEDVRDQYRREFLDNKPKQDMNAAAKTRSEEDDRARKLAEQRQNAQVVAAKQATPALHVKQAPVNVDTKVNLNGREIARAKGKTDMEAMERLGMKVGSVHRRIAEGTGFVAPAIPGVT